MDLMERIQTDRIRHDLRTRHTCKRRLSARAIHGVQGTLAFQKLLIPLA